MNKSIITLDKVFAALFAALGLTAAYGVIVKGAWWHIGTVAIAVVVFGALVRDARKEAEHGE
jgi:hypothetical protein